MPSLGSGEATAVARTTVSPVVTSAAPEACLAMRPVSKTRRLPPASSTATSCLDIESSFHFFTWETCRWKAPEGVVRLAAYLLRLQAARKRVCVARGSGFSRPMRKARAQPMAVRRPWQHLQFARYTMAPESGWNGGRDQYPVWALPI